DLIEMQAIYFDGDDGENVRYEAIPEAHLERAKAARHHMLETLSMSSDELMGLMLEEQEIPVDLIYKTVRAATLSHSITPVMMGSAYKNKGVQELLDAITMFLPSPLDRDLVAIDNDKKSDPANPPTDPHW